MSAIAITSSRTFLVINRFSFIEIHQLEVVIFHHLFQFVSEGCFIKRVANARDRGVPRFYLRKPGRCPRPVVPI